MQNRHASTRRRRPGLLAVRGRNPTRIDETPRLEAMAQAKVVCNRLHGMRCRYSPDQIIAYSDIFARLCGGGRLRKSEVMDAMKALDGRGCVQMAGRRGVRVLSSECRSRRRTRSLPPCGHPECATPVVTAVERSDGPVRGEEVEHYAQGNGKKEVDPPRLSPMLHHI